MMEVIRKKQKQLHAAVSTKSSLIDRKVLEIMCAFLESI